MLTGRFHAMRLSCWSISTHFEAKCHGFSKFRLVLMSSNSGQMICFMVEGHAGPTLIILFHLLNIIVAGGTCLCTMKTFNFTFLMGVGFPAQHFATWPNIGLKENFLPNQKAEQTDSRMQHMIQTRTCKYAPRCPGSSIFWSATIQRM